MPGPRGASAPKVPDPSGAAMQKRPIFRLFGAPMVPDPTGATAPQVPGTSGAQKPLAFVRTIVYNMFCVCRRQAQNVEVAGMAQSVAHLIGSEEVTGSIPVASSQKGAKTIRFLPLFALCFRKSNQKSTKTLQKFRHVTVSTPLQSRTKTIIILNRRGRTLSSKRD